MINYDQKIKKINQEKEQWEKKKEYLSKKQQIKEMKQSVKSKKLSTSKILMFFLLLNCTAIEIFTGIITVMNINIAREMFISPDLTPLVALISAVVGQTVGFAIYSVKAAKQNCRGGIVYEQAMFQANKNFMYEQQEENINNGMDYDILASHGRSYSSSSPDDFCNL